MRTGRIVLLGVTRVGIGAIVRASNLKRLRIFAVMEKNNGRRSARYFLIRLPKESIVQLDIRVLDHLGPLGDLGVDEGLELFG